MNLGRAADQGATPPPWLVGVARRAVRPSLLALALAAVAPPAAAVLTYMNNAGVRSITLQVGSAGGTINTVTFDVLTTNLAPTPTPVTGVSGNLAPATTPVGGILVTLSTNRRGSAPDVVKLTANASTALACTAGTCMGSGATIPFDSIAWTSFESGGGAFSAGIPSGAFTGGGAQLLFSNTIPAGPNDSLTASNVLVFRYLNTTLYPSGTYRGQVIFTASVP